MTAPQTKKVAALDVGNKRIGISITNLIARLPQPHGVVYQDAHTVQNIKKLISEQNITAIVLGLPRGLDGQDTSQTKLVKGFADELKKSVDVPVYFQDEALTTMQAETELHQKGLYNKEAVDALAATYILSDFLAQHPEVE